jgi:S-formylglutathione hydrolase FrmB
VLLRQDKFVRRDPRHTVDYPLMQKELKPKLPKAACIKAVIPLTLRRQAGYEHSYYFISTFMADHLAWHAERLGQ